MSTVINGSSPSITFSDGTTQSTAANISSPYTANGVVYASSTSALATGSGLVFDGSNLGLGVTPNANSISVGLDLAGGAGLFGFANQTELTCNAYYSAGAWRYKASAYATLYQMQSGQHQWNIASTGTATNAISFTQAMTLDNSGNLLVGTTSATSILTVGNGSAANKVITINGGTGASLGAGVVLQRNSTQTAIFSTDSLIGGSADGASIWSSEATRFYTNGSNERMRIDSSGNLLVGTTSSFGGGKICTVFDGSVSNGINLKTTYASTGSQFAAFYNSAGTQIGYINQNATSSVNYNTSSDSRLKTLIGVATDTSVIDNIVVNDFTWKIDGATDRGVFAQDVYSIKPTAVSKGRDDTLNEDGLPVHPWGVDYSKFVPDLIVHAQQLKKQVQELNTLVTTQAQTITAMQSQITALQTKVGA